MARKIELAGRQSWAVQGLVGHKGLSQEQQEAFVKVTIKGYALKRPGWQEKALVADQSRYGWTNSAVTLKSSGMSRW